MVGRVEAGGFTIENVDLSFDRADQRVTQTIEEN